MGLMKELFMEQSVLIKSINKSLSKDMYSNFVPNYKNLATVYKIFNMEDVPPKAKILLENNLINELIAENKEKKQQMLPHDNLLLRTFTKNFNAEYSSKLLEEQKTLLNKYILSFVDNGVELKIFLNEEVGRLKKVVSSSMRFEDIKTDEEMLAKTKSVMTVLENFKYEKINSNLLSKVLKIQNLAKEILN